MLSDITGVDDNNAVFDDALIRNKHYSDALATWATATLSTRIASHSNYLLYIPLPFVSG